MKNKTPVFLVTASLTVATALTATFLIVTGTRGENTSFTSSAGQLEVQTVASGLVNPWSLAFLPDGRMLVTERPGRMRIVTSKGQLSPPLKGVPEVLASVQGGLHDVVTDTSFAQNRTIYFCFAERTAGGGRTALARARLNDSNDRLDDPRIIFRQEGPLSSGNHYGCRIAQASDGNLFVTLGEHFNYRDEAQNLGNHLGKIIRIAPDGSVPADNPFVGRAGAKPEIWSYGHRNEQGLAVNPAKGAVCAVSCGTEPSTRSPVTAIKSAFRSLTRRTTPSTKPRLIVGPTCTSLIWAIENPCKACGKSTTGIFTSTMPGLRRAMTSPTRLINIARHRVS